MIAKTLDLRGLSNAERDAMVNCAIAETQGWIDCRLTKRGFPIGQKPGTMAESYSSIPPYSTSADAVLPLLEMRTPWRADCGGEHGYFVQVWKGISSSGQPYETGNAQAFPLAACLALLRANSYDLLT